MSRQGLEKFGMVLSQMQTARIELLGSKDEKGNPDHQDILLGQLLEDMKEWVKEKFMNVASGKYPDGLGRIKTQ